jgi:hypothetical protein
MVSKPAEEMPNPKTLSSREMLEYFLKNNIVQSDILNESDEDNLIKATY